MRAVFFLLFIGFHAAHAAAEELVVKVKEVYADLHTGPASEYPIFHALERGETVTVLKKRTGWYKVRTAKGMEGWLPQAALAQTLYLDGTEVAISGQDFDAYQQRTWEFAVFGGRFEDVSALSVSAAWVMTPNIVAEISATQALGDFSENQLFVARLQHYTFPEWRLSPYLTLGAGRVRTRPRANLVQSGDEVRTSDLLEVGAGLRYYLKRNFVLRLEYKNLLALTDRDDQEELNEWKLGLSVFF